MLQVEGLQVRLPIRSQTIFFQISSKRNEYRQSSWGLKCGRHVGPTTSAPSVRYLSRKFRSALSQFRHSTLILNAQERFTIQNKNDNISYTLQRTKHCCFVKQRVIRFQYETVLIFLVTCMPKLQYISACNCTELCQESKLIILCNLSSQLEYELEKGRMQIVRTVVKKKFIYVKQRHAV